MNKAYRLLSHKTNQCYLSLSALPFGALRELLSVRDIFSMCFHPCQPLPSDPERSVPDRLSFLQSICTHLFSSDCGYQAAEHEPSPWPFAKQLFHYRWRVQRRRRPQGAHEWAALIICSFTGRRRGKWRSMSADGAEGKLCSGQAPLFLGLPVFRCDVQVIFSSLCSWPLFSLYFTAPISSSLNFMTKLAQPYFIDGVGFPHKWHWRAVLESINHLLIALVQLYEQACKCI